MPVADILTDDAMDIVMEHLSITDALVVRETSEGNRRNPAVVRRLEAEMKRAKRESFARLRESRAINEIANNAKDAMDDDDWATTVEFRILSEDVKICCTEMMAALQVQWHYDQVHYDITGDDEYSYPPYDVEDA